MLKGIPSILSPELLKILMEMGHGDEIVIGDGNFPAASNAQRLVRCDGHACPSCSTLCSSSCRWIPMLTRLSRSWKPHRRSPPGHLG